MCVAITNGKKKSGHFSRNSPLATFKGGSNEKTVVWFCSTQD